MSPRPNAACPTTLRLHCQPRLVARRRTRAKASGQIDEGAFVRGRDDCPHRDEIALIERNRRDEARAVRLNERRPKGDDVLATTSLFRSGTARLEDDRGDLRRANRAA